MFDADDEDAAGVCNACSLKLFNLLWFLPDLKARDGFVTSQPAEVKAGILSHEVKAPAGTDENVSETAGRRAFVYNTFVIANATEFKTVFKATEKQLKDNPTLELWDDFGVPETCYIVRPDIPVNVTAGLRRVQVGFERNVTMQRSIVSSHEHVFKGQGQMAFNCVMYANASSMDEPGLSDVPAWSVLQTAADKRRKKSSADDVDNAHKSVPCCRPQTLLSIMLMCVKSPCTPCSQV